MPIEGELLPLLRAMDAEAKGRGELFDSAVFETDLAEQLRADLRTAGVERRALFVSNATHKPVTFHDLRSTGLTWAAVRGDSLSMLRARAGHETISTTDGYIRMGENLRGPAFGTVFPPLPAELIGHRLDNGPGGTGQSGPVEGSGDKPSRETTAKGANPAELRAFKSPSSHYGIPSNGAGFHESPPGRCPIDVQSPGGGDVDGTAGAGPRTVLIGHLADAVRALASVGDLSAARIAAAALQALLVSAEGESARVVDLASERERRER